MQLNSGNLSTLTQKLTKPEFQHHGNCVPRHGRSRNCPPLLADPDQQSYRNQEIDSQSFDESPKQFVDNKAGKVFVFFC
jgi:hypothetical protein